MAKYNFTATQGVQFGEHADNDPSKPFSVWAQFSPVPEGQPGVYAFSTDDAKVAERVRKVEGYGIEEVKGKDADDKPASAKELKAEIDRRNAERVDADKIKPKSNSQADLQAALDADGLV